MKRLNQLLSLLLVVLILAATVFVNGNIALYAHAQTIGYVNATSVNIREDATASSKSLGKVSNSYITVNGLKQGNDGYTWYSITYGEINGYIRSEFVVVPQETNDSSFEQQISNFPESYKESLRLIHSLYPNWSFYVDQVPMTLEQAVALEIPNRRKEVSEASPISWRSMGQDSYDWGISEWAVDNGGWVAASRELIAYYMDPRNFLNPTDIFAFMQQGYNPATQTAEGVAKIVSGTFLAETYNDPNDTAYGGSYVNVIMEAANQSGVSPYILAATIIQEQGVSGSSSLISGNTSYGKVYNFFNVKASGGTNEQIIANGLNYASTQGWTTRSASIIGGAKFVGNDYIANGQDTYFYMNYNILNPNNLWKQYAQAVHNAVSSGKKVASTYSSNTSAALTFRIPVYQNMSETVSACPQQNGNRNNYYLTSMNVSGLTPTFTMYNYNYDLKVTADTTINVTVPEGASLISPATYTISPGDSKVVLTVKAESGYTTDYVINVNSVTHCTISVPGGVGTTTVTTDDNNGQSGTQQIVEEPPPVVKAILKGDTNSDGKVSLIDLANVQKHLLGIKTLSGDDFTGADTNSDGKISLIDLANIQKHLLGVKLLS